MATRIRTFNQLDDNACNSVIATYGSHNNCLITEPTLTVDFSSGYLVLSWTSFIAMAGGQVYSVPSGSYQVDNGNMPATNVYCYFKPSQNPLAISFSYDSFPVDDYVMIGMIRYKTAGGVQVYVVNPNNHSIVKAMNKTETSFGLARPIWLGGLLPISVDETTGNISIGSSGFVRWGVDVYNISSMSSGDILVANGGSSSEYIVGNIYSISQYADGTLFGSDDVVGILIALNVGGLDISIPYLACAPKYVGQRYTEIEEGIQDSYGMIPQGFEGEYFRSALPLMIYIYKRDDHSKKAVISLLHEEYSYRTIVSEQRSLVLEKGYISLTNATSYNVVFSQNRYNYIPCIQLTGGTMIGYYFSGIGDAGFTVNFSAPYTGGLYYWIII